MSCDVSTGAKAHVASVATVGEVDYVLSPGRPQGRKLVVGITPRVHKDLLVWQVVWTCVHAGVRLHPGSFMYVAKGSLSRPLNLGTTQDRRLEFLHPKGLCTAQLDPAFPPPEKIFHP
jgi:hypothetical protein